MRDMAVPFHLEEIPHDAPAVTDDQGSVWRLLTPTGDHPDETRQEYERCGGCPHLCHWVSDNADTQERRILEPGKLPCTHQKVEDLVPGYIVAPDVVVSWGRNWYLYVTVYTLSPIVTWCFHDKVAFTYDEYLRILKELGHSTTELDGPENQAIVARIEAGEVLYNLFTTKDEHERHADTLRQPSRSPRWRERDQEIRRMVAELAEQGWTDAHLASAEGAYAPHRNRLRPWWGWEHQDNEYRRLEVCYALGVWAEENGPGSRNDSAAPQEPNDAVAELLGW